MKVKLFYLWFAIFCGHTYAQQDPTSTIQMDNVEGLSNPNVVCLAKDAQGYLWIGTSNGLNRYDGNNTIVYKNQINDSNSISGNSIRYIHYDHQNRLWVISTEGISRYEPKYNDFSNYYFRKEGRKLECFSIIEDTDGTLYALLEENDIYKYDENSNCFVLWKSFFNYSQIYNGIFFEKYLFIATQFEILKIDVNENRISRTYKLTKGSVGSSRISNLIINNGYLWITGYNIQLHRINIISNEIQLLPHPEFIKAISIAGKRCYLGSSAGLFEIDPYVDQLNKASPKAVTYEVTGIFDLLTDVNENLWIASNGQGVSMISNNKVYFSEYDIFPEKESSLGAVNAISITKKGMIWASTNQGFLYCRAKKGSNYQERAFDVGVHLLFDVKQFDKRYVWISTYEKGLIRYDVITGKLKFYTDSHGIRGKDIRDIEQDKQGNLWLALHGQGVDIFDPHSEKVVHSIDVNPENDRLLNDGWVFDIEPVNGGESMWVASATGLHLIQNSVQRFFPTATDQSSSIQANTIRKIKIDHSDNLWLGTDKGIHLLNNKDSTFREFTNEQGLSDNLVTGIVSVPSGEIFVATQDGLNQILYDKGENTYKIRSISVSGENISNIFKEGSGSFDTLGNVCFQTTKGPLKFNVKEIFAEKSLPGDIHFTQFKLFSKEVPICHTCKTADPKELILPAGVNYLDSIQLEHFQNSISIAYTCVEFFHQNELVYQHMLEGYEQDWVNDLNYHEAVYTLLPPGYYKFKVRAFYKGAPDNFIERTLDIEISKPWHQTIWGKTLMGIGILSIFLLITIAIVNQIKFKNQKILNQKNKELEDMKIRFFMNVSHEFRTPLTLILGPLENLRKKSFSLSESFQIQLIHQNTKRLLRLVNQLLDLRRLEFGAVKLRIKESDVVSFVNGIFKSFYYMADRHNIQYFFESEAKEFIVPFDHDVLEKILYNLISNAFKFTSSGGTIKIVLAIDENEKLWKVEVTDTGQGISSDHITHIFSRFYVGPQLQRKKNSGIGIGLALCKELVELHHGALNVSSKVGLGSTFSFKIPYNKDIYASYEWIETNDKVIEEIYPHITDDEDVKMEFKSDVKINSGSEIIMVVDDNPDVIVFLQMELEKKYRIIPAKNGKDALYQLERMHNLPNLIITDVMMPEMDGYELCEKIKSDSRFSHIPVIMLTAKVEKTDLIKGLNYGADEYLPKPFDVNEIQLRIHNILETRKKMIVRFNSEPEALLTNNSISELDKSILKKAIAFVEDNFGKENISVEDLAKHLGMGKTSLFVKFKAITGQSVGEFIKTIQLKRAANLLLKKEKNISEVCYMTGFSDPKHFRMLFKKQFGLTPSAYIKSKTKNMVN